MTIVRIGHARASSSAPSVSAPRVSTNSARDRRARPRARVAATSSSNRRPSAPRSCRRYPLCPHTAAASPQTSRATSVSSSTGGTPRIQRFERRMAEAFVFRKQRERPRPSDTVPRARRRRRTAESTRCACRSLRAAAIAGRSWCGYVRLSPTISRRAAAWPCAIGLNARIRSGRWRRLNTEPTNSTSGSAVPAAVAEALFVRRRAVKSRPDRCTARGWPEGRNAR